MSWEVFLEFLGVDLIHLRVWSGVVVCDFLPNLTKMQWCTLELSGSSKMNKNKCELPSQAGTWILFKIIHEGILDTQSMVFSGSCKRW